MAETKSTFQPKYCLRVKSVWLASQRYTPAFQASPKIDYTFRKYLSRSKKNQVFSKTKKLKLKRLLFQKQNF